MSTLALLLQVAFRNLFKSWINLVIGFVIFFATLLVVFGGAFLDSLDSSLSRSIVGSVAGHLQVYSDHSKEELALFGGNMGEDPNLSPVERFSVLRDAVAQHPNVKQVVPMGVSSAIVTTGNAVDHALEQLRALYREQAPGKAADPARQARIDSLKSHVRRLAGLMKAEQATQKEMLREGARDAEEAQALARAQSEAFWAEFDRDPLANLEYLENQLAPQAAEGEMVPFRYIGTDPDAFQQSFDRMEIVDGEAIPRGERGIVLAKLFYEEAFKLKSARRLDKIKEGLDTGRRTLATDPELQRLMRENTNQLREIQYQLDPLKAAEATRRLQRVLGSQEQDLGKLLQAFFQTDDQNFPERYRQFYAELGPLLELYRVKPGQLLTLSAVGQSGYVQSSNVRVWGTFRFKGMEKSPTAGFINVMDLVTFRELFGQPTAETREEIQALKASAGAREVKREEAEADLFGGGSEQVSEGGTGQVDADALLGGGTRREPAVTTYAPGEIEQGMVLSAAVILKDPDALQSTMEELRELPAVKAASLRIVDWQKAVGTFGQLVLMLRVALWVIITILAVVVLAVINNAMMMATLRRTREIGTLRAIGAQRAFVLAMVLVETMVLSLVFGLSGMGAGALLVKGVNALGIPAVTDEMQFFFSGPRLDLFVSPTSLVAAFVMVVVVTALSTLYPAVQATRIAPVTAMQSEE